MRWLLALVAVALLATRSEPAHAEDAVPPILREVGFTQHLGATIPTGLVFRDEHDQTVSLGAYLGVRPIILTLNDLSCPNLCSLELDGLATGLGGLDFTLGQDYAVVTVSINPRDTPAVAAETKSRYVWRSSRLGPGDGWHVLTGDAAASAALARAVGFGYAYDAQQEQFVHPTGVVVLTPDGRIARYLYGLDFPTRDLRFALIEASHRQIGSPVDQLLLTCYHYDATLGRYSGLALEAVRVGGGLTVLALAIGLGLLWRADLRRGRDTRTG